MSARIRFVQFDVPHSTVHGPDSVRGFPLPEDCAGWVPFQSEIRGSLKGDEYLVIAVWLREETP